jgi:hypothetical protein
VVALLIPRSRWTSYALGRSGTPQGETNVAIVYGQNNETVLAASRNLIETMCDYQASLNLGASPAMNASIMMLHTMPSKRIERLEA